MSNDLLSVPEEKINTPLRGLRSRMDENSSYILKVKPAMPFVRTTMAAKLKRRSINMLREREASTQAVIMPRDIPASKMMGAGDQRRMLAKSNIQRQAAGSTGLSSSQNQSQNRTAANKNYTAAKPTSTGTGGRIPFGSSKANSSAKAMAEQAIQKKKPPPFVSRREKELREQISKLERDNEIKMHAVATIRNDLDTVKANFDALNITAQRDANALAELKAVHQITLDQLNSTKAFLQENRIQLDDINKRHEQAIAQLVETQTQLNATLQENGELTDRIWRGEAERRYLHNLLLELKGNIRVFCRIRPMLTNGFGNVQTIEFPKDDDKKLIMLKPNDTHAQTPMHGKNSGTSANPAFDVTPYPFEFDKVFKPGCKQMEVFEEISQLVQSVIDGYNVCVFAYGQTGSGKTFTMEGPPQLAAAYQSEPYGMIELSARRIFEAVSNMQKEGWQFSVEASFIEIYNETVLDMLVKDPSKVNDKLDIKMVAPNENDVAGLTKYFVTSIDELGPLLLTAQGNRTIASTKCNDRSSRSHSIFRLRLRGSHPVRGLNLEGTLNLVDLAGSECLKKSESEGQQLKEAQNINRSLMTLGKVILALVNGDNHVPYRESKLTYLLQNSLGGNSKTLMFVTISPEPNCINESLNSLRFASQVNQCQVGTATKNISIANKKSK